MHKTDNTEDTEILIIDDLLQRWCAAGVVQKLRGQDEVGK
jgi:hypothetical protein